MNEVKLDQFDAWIKDDSPYAAIVYKQYLEPVEGKDAVIFPPTYASPEGWKGDWLGYNIDHYDDGSNICQIDSVGSQANRIEPIFKKEPYSKLVPQINVRAGDREISILDAGHRAADAIVLFSELREKLESAYLSFRDNGNAKSLAKISPTSIVFGSWDSRSTQVKLQRIVRSVIRAFDVKPLHRSAQYIPAIDYVDEGLLDEPENKTQQDSMSQLGLSHAPAPWTHGGVKVQREIRRDATLNLVAVRALGTDSNNENDILNLRRYILGLSLVSFTAPQETNLREGCQLIPDIENESVWNIIKHDGNREPFSITHDEALSFAQTAAEAFGVGENQEVTFDSSSARKALGQTKEERKASRKKTANK